MNRGMILQRVAALLADFAKSKATALITITVSAGAPVEIVVSTSDKFVATEPHPPIVEKRGG